MKNIDRDAIFSIGYYQREQWPLLLETADDRQAIEDTYDDWTLSVEKSLKNIRAAGIEPLRVDVDVHELLAWCKAQGMKNTGAARAEFFAELCRQGRGKKIAI